MSFEKELSINDYYKIAKRKLPYIIGFFFVSFLCVLAFAILKSPIYQSTATIQIDSPHIASQEAKETFATERFAKLNQVVLSKDNLIRIAKKYKLYGLDENNNIPSETLYFATRGNINIEKLKAEAEGWESSSTFAFNVSFQHYSAQETYDITNELVNLFLKENDKFTKGRVLETEEFFSKEEEKKRTELEDVENRLTSFKRRYADSLPENKGVYTSALERLENDLRANQLEYRATKAELRSLDVSLEAAKAGKGSISATEPLSGSSELQSLRAEMAKLNGIYSDSHPSVRALKRRIEALETSSISKTEKPVSLSTSDSIVVAKVQAQIDTAKDRLESIKSEEASIRARISQAENSIMRSGQTEGEMGALMREYENAKVAYNDIKAKLESSKIAKNIELENKGERFILIEAPILPDKPIKPNRKLIIAVGFIGSIMLSVVLAILLDFIGKGVRGVENIASIMNIQPLVAIPYIVSQAEEKRKKRLLIYLIFSILILFIFTMLVVHFFVMPLDLLASKIATRF
jgi:polysaccharide biosynthesis transport protein